MAEAGKDPDILTRELYDRIDKKTFPKWKVSAQIIDPAKADKSDVNIFDATRVIPESTFPWTEIGEITLDEPPQNFFTQVEQAGFNVANVVPGWDISPDPSRLPHPRCCDNVPNMITPQFFRSACLLTVTLRGTGWVRIVTSCP